MLVCKFWFLDKFNLLLFYSAVWKPVYNSNFNLGWIISNEWDQSQFLLNVNLWAQVAISLTRLTSSKCFKTFQGTLIHHYLSFPIKILYSAFIGKNRIPSLPDDGRRAPDAKRSPDKYQRLVIIDQFNHRIIYNWKYVFWKGEVDVCPTLWTTL